MKEDKVFVDTNVLVYAYDMSAGKKAEVAREILLELWDKGTGVVSTQILQEFYVVVTRKIPHPMDARTARGIIEDLMLWEVVVNDGNSILEAIDISERHRLSFWDSLVVQAASRSGASELLSEDLHPGRTAAGIQVRNPFKSA
jgi:predicted nucleic acid-binding protein